MAQSHDAALRNAEVGVDEIAKFDFYSCFPAPVEMALRVLHLDPADSRGFTVTGGLPYGGGPGSAYTLHSLATMHHELRAAPGAIGMVTGNGWYLTKQSAVILSTDPPRAVRPSAATPALSEAAAKRAQPVPLRRGRGPGRIDSYTVAHDRSGPPVRGMIVGSFSDGTRFVANTRTDPEVLAALEAEEMIGRTGRVVDDGGPTLCFDLD
jgi:acetyl-CoA C-acetyltransferase